MRTKRKRTKAVLRPGIGLCDSCGLPKWPQQYEGFGGMICLDCQNAEAGRGQGKAVRAPKKLVLLELKTAGEKEIQAWKDAQVEIAVANALQGTVAASDMKATVELLENLYASNLVMLSKIHTQITRLKALVKKAEGEA